jgi:hypothetical protein
MRTKKEILINYLINYLIAAGVLNVIIIVMGFDMVNEILNLFIPTFLSLLLFFVGVFFLITPLEKAKIFVSEFYLYSSVALLTLATISTYPEAYNIFGKKLINYGLFMFNPIISLFSFILSRNMASFQELFLQIVFISLLLIYPLANLTKNSNDTIVK